MAIETKSLAETTEKWVRRAGQATSDYNKGVGRPKRPWKASTLAAEENFVTGVTDAIARGAFGKGVEESSDEEWKRMAQGKGTRNYPGGVRDGEIKYTRKMGPVLSHMQAITLPPPGPRGSPQNIQRSVAFQEGMAKFRTG